MSFLKFFPIKIVSFLELFFNLYEEIWNTSSTTEVLDGKVFEPFYSIWVDWNLIFLFLINLHMKVEVFSVKINIEDQYSFTVINSSLTVPGFGFINQFL